MSNRRFLLPAIIAVALHAIVLLGFRGHAVAVVPPPPPPKKVFPPPLPDVLQVEARESGEPDRSSRGGHARNPSLPELPTPPRDDGFLFVPISNPAVDTGGFLATKINWLPSGDGPVDGGGGSGPLVIPSDLLDRVPNARLQGGPTYPPQLRYAGIEGEVLVEFDVNERGTVTRAAVRHSTHHEFDEPTLRAVLKWRFEPGRRHGLVVPFRMAVPVRFRLNEI